MTQDVQPVPPPLELPRRSAYFRSLDQRARRTGISHDEIRLRDGELARRVLELPDDCLMPEEAEALIASGAAHMDGPDLVVNRNRQVAPELLAHVSECHLCQSLLTSMQPAAMLARENETVGTALAQLEIREKDKQKFKIAAWAPPLVSGLFCGTVLFLAWQQPSVRRLALAIGSFAGLLASLLIPLFLYFWAKRIRRRSKIEGLIVPARSALLPCIEVAGFFFLAASIFFTYRAFSQSVAVEMYRITMNVDRKLVDLAGPPTPQQLEMILAQDYAADGKNRWVLQRMMAGTISGKLNEGALTVSWNVMGKNADGFRLAVSETSHDAVIYATPTIKNLLQRSGDLELPGIREDKGTFR